MSMSATLGGVVGVRCGGVRQRDAMRGGARSMRASRAPMVVRKGGAGIQIRAAIESRPEHKKQSSGGFDFEDIATAGAAMSEMAATGGSAGPVSVIARQAELDVAASFEEQGSALSTGTGSAKLGLRGVKANRINIGGLLGCDREQHDVSTGALPKLQRLDKGNKYPVLFYAPEMEDLATRIAGEEVCGGVVELGSIDWRTFPDGFPNLFVNDAYGVRDRHVAFLASFHSPEVIFEQLSVIYSLPKMFVASFTLILPFFPTGTSERVEREGEVATAVTLARILSNIPPSRGGPCSTLIFDIHALQERFYFGDNILPCFESGIPLLLNRLAQCEDADNIIIAYPDEGAWKRFHTFFKGMEEVVCTKVREGDKRLVKLKEGEPAGRHVIIVDDLVQSGGTLIECQKLLSRLGAVKVSAYVTHGVFPGNSWKKFCSGGGGQGFYKFFLTDSCPGTAEAVKGTEPFEILSLSRPIAEALHV